MSFQLGFGIGGDNSEIVSRSVDLAARDVGLASEKGLDSFWEELRPSLNSARRDFSWSIMGVIQGENYSLDHDLGKLVTGKECPIVFGFFRALDDHLDGVVGQLDFIFAQNWAPGSPARVASGRIGDLLILLRSFKDWEGYYYTSGRSEYHQGSHDVPMIYRCTRERPEGRPGSE